MFILPRLLTGQVLKRVERVYEHDEASDGLSLETESTLNSNCLGIPGGEFAGVAGPYKEMEDAEVTNS